MIRGESKLNKQQLKAVKHKAGPLLIIAGAGTGKTAVITERIKYLIEKGLANPSEILALTFTEKAAREMETRVDEALPYGYTQMWIMTFHSFCDRVLRAEALHIGLDPKYKLMSEALSTQLVRNNLFEFNLDYFRPLGNPTKFISGMLQHFSRLQDEDVNPVDYLAYSKKLKSDQKLEIKKTKELADAYRKYDELKVKEGVMDFGDLIVKTLKLFRDRPNILSQYQKKFKYILIDEFQDTNFAQNELALLLSKKHKNIAVVGDDDQSVYRFRGAAVSNIIQFRKNFPKAKVVVLTTNYRSTQEILDRSYDLVQFNNPDRLEVVEKIDKKLKSVVKEKGEQIIFFHLDRVENEAQCVAQEIKKLKETDNYSWKDFAILVRANGHADPFVRALTRYAIPHQFLGPGRLFKQPEIIELISYLKVLYSFDDSAAFYRLLSIDYFDINVRDIIKINSHARKLNLSLFESCEQLKDIAVSDQTKQKIGKLMKLIKSQFKVLKNSTAGQILYNFLEESGMLQNFVNPDTSDAQKRALNISSFFDKLKTYEVDHEDATVPAVVDWIDLASELGESPQAADTDWQEVNAVNILTVHSAKGLEFPVVFLVNLVSQRFPTIERSEQIPIPEKLIKEILPSGDYHLEEERRLFYVGMTRAKERLYFTAANFYGEGKRDKKLSPFIHEALGDKVGSLKVVDSIKQLSFLDFKVTNKPFSKLANQPIHVDYLSYSQIETFKLCPLHYKLKYIYKIPTRANASASFGTAVHGALKDFYNDVKKGEKPTVNLIVRLLKKNWVNDGFKSKAHEDKFFQKGKIYLKGFLRVGFDPKILTAKLEEPFLIPIKSEPLKEAPLKVGGKIDRVDVVGPGLIEIIDYKTSEKVPSQREVDKNLQLSLYALAATTLKEKPFGVEAKDVKLSLYYLDTQEKLSTMRTTKQLKSAMKEIYKVRCKIEGSEFKCSGNYFCKDCEYKTFCATDIE